MRDFMIQRSLHGYRMVHGMGGGGSTVFVRPMTDVTLKTPTEPPSTRWSATSVGGGRSSSPLDAASIADPRAGTSAKTGSPSGSMVRVATVKSAAPLPGTLPLTVTDARIPADMRVAGGIAADGPGSPRNDLITHDLDAIDAAEAVRTTDADPSVPAASGVIYGSEGGVTTSSALSGWWARYGVWALSLGGGALLALFAFWMMGKRRR